MLPLESEVYFMNPVDITVLSEKVKAVLRERGLKEKSIKEFERYCWCLSEAGRSV